MLYTQEPLLIERQIGRCPEGTIPPAPELPPPEAPDIGVHYNFGSHSYDSYITKINDDHVYVSVHNFGLSLIQNRAFELVGVDELFNSANLTINTTAPRVHGYAIQYLSDNKLVQVYKIGTANETFMRTLNMNPDGSIDTITGTTSLGTTIYRPNDSGGFGTPTFAMDRVSASRVVLIGHNSNTGVLHARVVDIDGGGLLTLGALNSTITGAGTYDVVMLTATRGVIASTGSNGVQSTTKLHLFSISGSTITIEDSVLYPTVEQWPDLTTSDILRHPRLSRISDTEALVMGNLSRSGVSGFKPGGFVVTDTGTTLDAPVIFQDTAEPVRDGSYEPGCLYKEGIAYMVHHNPRNSDTEVETVLLRYTVTGNVLAKIDRAIMAEGFASESPTYVPEGVIDMVEIANNKIIVSTTLFTDVGFNSTLESYLIGWVITVPV